MASLIKLGITVLVVLGVVAGNAGVGRAGVIISPCAGATPCAVKIDDLTETPTVKVFDGTSDVTSLLLSSLPDTAGEFLHFTLSLLLDPPQQSFYSDLFEDHLGGTLSDRLVVTFSGNLLDVQFASDPATIPPGTTHLTDFVENGAFQSLFTLGDYEFQVRSDVDVPAPATLFLVGSALVGLSAVAWRRRRG